MTERTPPHLELTAALREEFRSHLETLYSRLKLAPPYESVEQAIRALTTAVNHTSNGDQARLAQDSHLKWELFRQAFERSGLAKKHRGIIAGLLSSQAHIDLPAEYEHFLSFFRSDRP